MSDHPVVCPNNHCENLTKFEIRTTCACADKMYSCYMCLPIVVMQMSEREDSHRDSKRITVEPLDIDPEDLLDD